MWCLNADALPLTSILFTFQKEETKSFGCFVCTDSSMILSSIFSAVVHLFLRKFSEFILQHVKCSLGTLFLSCFVFVCVFMFKSRQRFQAALWSVQSPLLPISGWMDFGRKRRALSECIDLATKATRLLVSHVSWYYHCLNIWWKTIWSGFVCVQTFADSEFWCWQRRITVHVRNGCSGQER